LIIDALIAKELIKKNLNVKKKNRKRHARLQWIVSKMVFITSNKSVVLGQCRVMNVILRRTECS
jgi:hypothetical protein